MSAIILIACYSCDEENGERIRARVEVTSGANDKDLGGWEIGSAPAAQPVSPVTCGRSGSPIANSIIPSLFKYSTRDKASYQTANAGATVPIVGLANMRTGTHIHTLSGCRNTASASLVPQPLPLILSDSDKQSRRSASSLHSEQLLALPFP